MNLFCLANILKIQKILGNKMRRVEEQQIVEKKHLSFPRWYSQGDDKINKQTICENGVFFSFEKKMILIE